MWRAKRVWGARSEEADLRSVISARDLHAALHDRIDSRSSVILLLPRLCWTGFSGLSNSRRKREGNRLRQVPISRAASCEQNG